MSSAPQVFRYELLPIWRLQTTVCTMATLAIWLLLSLLLDRPLRKPDFLLSASLFLLVGFVLAIVTAAQRFRVSSEGLYTFDSLGRWRLLPWPSVAHVEPARFYFLPHLRLQVDAQQRSFWIPLFLKDMEGFRRAVSEHGGATHPVARALPRPASAASR